MDSIVASARQHLDGALNEARRDLPDPGPRWGTIAAWCRESVARFESARQVIHFAQTPTGHGGFEARLTGHDLARYAGTMEALLRREFPRAVSHFTSFVEPGISRPETTMIHEGRRIAGPTLAHMLFYFSCATRVPALDRVCEIGGGFGAPARLFLTNSFKRPRTYVIVDLPESLFFAEVYLRATLGNDRVRYVEAGETLDPAGDGVILCPVTRLAALTAVRFDLVLNTLSLQEMTDAYVTFYRDWLHELQAGYFYSFNRFMQSVTQDTEVANSFAPRLSERWEIVWSATLGDAPDRFVHVLARRADPSTVDERNALAIDRYFSRPLDIDAVYPLFHVAETTSDARFSYRLMSAVAEDFAWQLRELAFLAQLTDRLDVTGPCLTGEERRTVDRLRTQLASLGMGRRPRVPMHLREMQRDLYA